MRSTFNILFYLNSSKKKKSGLCPVMGRITVDGQIAQFSLRKDVHQDYWDAKRGCTTGKTREQIELNRKIEQTEKAIKNIYDRTVETIGYVTAEQIKNELTGKVRNPETLLALFMEHNQEYQKRVGIDRTESSYYTYVNSYNHLSRFVVSKYGLEDYPLRQLDMSFIDSYDLYLRVDAGLNSNSMVRHIVNLKKMVVRAMNQRTLLYDPFPEYVKNKLKYKYLHISKDELKTIMTTKIQSMAVSFIRDLFVFSCFTGLAYADIRQLSEKHLHKLSDGSIWIEIPRCKTDVESSIRLLNIPIAIIEKYQSKRKGERLLNMPSSGSVSKNMRKIEELCSITHLHFHMARHTFATQVCLNNGVTMEVLRKLMGHNSIRSTQNYGEITNQKVGNDMKRLADRLERKTRIKNENEQGKAT